VRLAERLLVVDAALDAAGLPHAFGGAFALAYATEHPRATVDIDLNVFVPAAHHGAVLDALPEGVVVTDADRLRLGRDGQTRLWWDATPLDLFLSTDRFHDHAAARVVRRPFADSSLPFLHPTDLVVFKAMFDRPKDRVDITAIAEAGTADMDEALGWVDRLLGPGSDQAAHLRESIAAAGAGPG
jgi:hypothetical protein